MSESLTEFLLARIAEDEAAARDAYYDGQVWIPEEEAVVSADRDLEPVMFLDRKRDAAHAYRWSPARVLAECEAKRRIVEDRGLLDTFGVPSIFGERILRALAPPYASHPDYDESWRP